MARRYSRKKGKSGSHKPSSPSLPSWVRYQEKEIEILISKLAKESKTPAEIGIILRDRYGVPNAKLITKKRIREVLEEKKLSKNIPEDLISLIRRSVKLLKHMEANKKDMTATRGILLTESKIRRLAKYYKREGILTPEWKYSRDTASMLAEY